MSKTISHKRILSVLIGTLLVTGLLRPVSGGRAQGLQDSGQASFEHFKVQRIREQLQDSRQKTDAPRGPLSGAWDSGKNQHLLLAAYNASALTAIAPANADLLTQSPETYVLTAGKWGDDQDEAVRSAGGTIIFCHDEAGIGVAISDEPDFLTQVLASGAITRGAADEVIQWQQPVHELALEETAVTPNDEAFINLQWNIKAVEAPAAWAAGYTGKGVRVAVLDYGFHNTHVDLVNNFDVTRSVSFVPGFTFNQDAGDFWHGTHVAGIIAAADNGIGTIGIAPEATIIGIKVGHSGFGGKISWLIRGILYASTPLAEGGAGADIINMSLGGTVERGGNTALLIAALNQAVNFAERNQVLVVSAAGNNGLDLDHSSNILVVPAMSGSGIAVSATGPEGYAVGYPNGATNFRAPASYTNFGVSLVNVAAPGGDFRLPGNSRCSIPAVPAGGFFFPCWVFDMVLSTAKGPEECTDCYAFAAGTSMAAPAATAVAALIKQRFPNISVGALKNKLANTADDEAPVGVDPYYGRGFVNARRAVTK